MINNQLRCPKHDHTDQIQKVSSVFSSGITSGTYSGPSVAVGTPIGKGQPTVTGGYTTLSGGSQSLLSHRLAPPEKPSAAGRSCLAMGFALFVLLLGGSVALQALMIFLSISSARTEVIGWLVLGGVIAGSLGGLLIWAGSALFRNNDMAAKKRAEQLTAQMPKWELAIERWNRLYYCARDDIVFDPDDEQRTFVTPEQMISYIYR